jgi:hypothetical protein
MARYWHDDRPLTGETLPDIREESHHDSGEDAVCAWIQGPGQTGQGINVWLNGSAAFQLYSLAEQLQSWKVDQHGPGSWWPRCPQHAGCGLTADIDGELGARPRTSRALGRSGHESVTCSEQVGCWV